MVSTRGSEWRRWDVHIHTPGTALADEYPRGSWDDYIARINRANPPAVALGVTDYFSPRGYKALRERWLRSDLPGVTLIFPNLEFRVSPPTTKHKGVNIHFLIDPSDDDHVAKVEGALARLSFEYADEAFNCDEAGLTRFGKRLDPSQKEDFAAYRRGVREFKIDFSSLRKWVREDPWLRKRSLIAVSNNDYDGVSGLPEGHGYGATLDEMFRFADVIFSGNPNDRKYWLGEGADNLDVLERRFGGAKPCLHGSDAHEPSRVLAPNLDRFCWIKAEPTFEGLRQVVLEPEERVHIGPDRPSRVRRNWIRSVTVEDRVWFPGKTIALNEGLVAIIGPRGSGKTALADLIACGTDSFEGGPASFLAKAKRETAGTNVRLEWADRDEPESRFVGQYEDQYPSARYLSQHFVEQLCSADGASERLIEEIESVVFEALDETDRSQASSFAELRTVVTADSVRRIQELRSEIGQFGEGVAREIVAKTELPSKRDRLKRLDADLAGIAQSFQQLVVKGKEEKAKALQKVRDEVGKLEEVVSDLKSKDRRLQELSLELTRRERENEEYHRRLRIELLNLGIAESDLSAFSLRFVGSPQEVLARRAEVIKREIILLSVGSTPPKPEEQPLAALRQRLEALQREIGGDSQKERQLVDLQRKNKQLQQERAKLVTEIERAERADGIIKELQARRLETYVEIFAEFSRQRQEMERLYQPLGDRLAAAPAERRKLAFFVRQVVDIDEWARRGEELIDLRRKTEFQERRSLAIKAEELLGEAWREGDPARVREGMATFLDIFKDVGKFLVPTANLAAFADWLFSTDHIRVTYGIRYEDTDIERLSPGTRGIVLLILYLALDDEDDRPLIIDQPEENLDPQSVFDVLTGYFREARQRRQLIVVTHNPNLVVNTDADQVVVASAERVPAEVLPRLTYVAGGLENPDIRTRVCRILEGGERAFLQREKRYALR